MGVFRCNLVRRGAVVQQIHAPNTLHDEGADYILRRMFPVGGSLAPPASFRICIGGINCDSPYARPNYTVGGGLPLTRATTYFEMTHPVANEGGGATDAHRTILGYARQAVTFTAAMEAGGAKVETPEVGFQNAVPWAPLGTYEPGEFVPPPWHRYQWQPLHGYPWVKPRWRDNVWGETGEPHAWGQSLSQNPNRAATFPVGVVFVISSAPALLIASALFTTCIEVRPGDTLYVKYSGRVMVDE